MKKPVTFDPVRLEVCWNRLISIASEQAATMVASSFSAVLGDMEDLSAGVFDAKGVMMAQSVQGAPGHLGSLSAGVKTFLDVFAPAAIAPGDVLITNDPWLVSGHKHDITVVTPVFLGRRLVGFTASNCHTVDIGGRIFSAAAAEVYEEGLLIPRMKLYDRGRRNETLFRMIEENVRSPELVLGDLHAQVSANQTAAARVLEFMRDQRLADLQDLSRAVTSRTDRLMRRAVRRLPDGVYRDRVQLDGVGAALEVAVAITIAGERITIDFAGTSPQVPKGVNSVLNFTEAFSRYAIKCLLAPDSPNNDGSFACIRVVAEADGVQSSEAMASTAMNPTLWRCMAYCGPGLPRPTSSSEARKIGFMSGPSSSVPVPCSTAPARREMARLAIGPRAAADPPTVIPGIRHPRPLRTWSEIHAHGPRKSVCLFEGFERQ